MRALLHAEEPDDICDNPADRDGEPDAGLAQRGGGEQIGEQNAQPERDDGQHHRHARAIHGAIVAVEQEQAADAKGQHGDKQQIQPDIEQGGDAEKPERRRRIAERTPDDQRVRNVVELL